MAPMSAFSVGTRGMRFAFKSFQSVSCAVGAWCDVPLASNSARFCVRARLYPSPARSVLHTVVARAQRNKPARRISRARLFLHRLVNRVLDIRREVDHARRTDAD